MVKSICRLAIFGLIWMATTAGNAGPVSGGVWYQFQFDAAGVPATGCETGCPAIGTPALFVQASAPVWSFSVGSGGASLKVTDAFWAGDSFRIFNGDATLGITPDVPATPTGAIDCEAEPDACYSLSGMSHSVFALASNDYFLSISAERSPYGFGTAFFRLDGDIQSIPTPGTLALTLLALSGLVASQLKRGRRTYGHHATLNQA